MKPIPPKKTLEKVYRTLGSIHALAFKFSKSNGTIGEWLRWYGIKRQRKTKAWNKNNLKNKI